MNWMRYTNVILAAVAAALTVSGCVRTRIDDCPDVQLDFSFTLNDSGAEQFAGSVGDVAVYVFDQSTGRLVTIAEATREDIARGTLALDGLTPGRYTFVVWGGSGYDLSRNFSAVHIADTATGTEAPVAVGTTTLDDFYLTLDSRPATGATEGDVIPADDEFDDLFFANARDVEVAGGDAGTRRVDFDFIRDASVLKVTLGGLGNLPGASTRADGEAPVRVFVTAPNGRYRWDNTIDPDAPVVRYAPPVGEYTGGSLSVDIKTLRMDVARHRGDDRILLYVQDNTGRNVIEPLDVLEAIMSVGGTRNPLYPDQAAIDRQYEISAGTLTLTEGGTVTVTATVEPSNATDTGVVWTSSDESVATVDSYGRVTAVGIGTATITVTTVDGAYTASCSVTVTARKPEDDPDRVPVTGVTVSPGSLTLTEGGTGSITATVSPATATYPGVVWSSSDGSVATVDASGNVTAVGTGTATITATTVDGDLTASCAITVVAKGSDDPGGPGGPGPNATVGVEVTVTINGWEVVELDAEP